MPDQNTPEPKGTPKDSAKSQPKDRLYQLKVFTDAKALLRYKQRPTDEVKNECLVGIDTNILLMPYQIDRHSLAEIAKVYKALHDKKRLIIPAQAVREFVAHRADKLGNIVQHLRDEGSKLYAPLKKKIGILDESKDFQQAKKGAVSIKDMNTELQRKLNDICNDLSRLVGDDPVSLLYAELAEAVKELDLNDAKHKEFLSDLDWRYAHKIPPGYMDASNPNGGVGDLIIWKTILEEGKNQSKDFIFVTAEEKQDWWVRNHGAFQPRIELLEEYRSFTGGCTIHIVTLSKLLQIFQARDDAIKSVLEAEQANTTAAVLSSTLGGFVSLSARPDVEYSFSTGGVSPAQAKWLVGERQRRTDEIATIDGQIIRQLNEPSLRNDMSELNRLIDIRNKLQREIYWIDGQLRLTPPGEN